jgi:hypothetical protein
LIEVRAAIVADIPYIDDLQRKNADALAFYPKVVFEREVGNRRIVLAFLNNQPCGYLYFGAFGENVKIHQACIQYDARGFLYGKQLVDWLKLASSVKNCQAIRLHCGSDLMSNVFWQSVGFICESVQPGGVRRMRDINVWRHDLSPMLFNISQMPSDKKQDASIWRAHKDGNQSQFMRGNRLKEYRAKVLAKSKCGDAV